MEPCKPREQFAAKLIPEECFKIYIPEISTAGKKLTTDFKTSDNKIPTPWKRSMMLYYTFRQYWKIHTNLRSLMQIRPNKQD